uniref:Uncharacterized protein n=1 Tax=Sphaerodactylus townsendi TaxID=933632 RepID=A0ACB8G8N2_9SAUR
MEPPSLGRQDASESARLVSSRDPAGAGSLRLKSLEHITFPQPQTPPVKPEAKRPPGAQGAVVMVNPRKTINNKAYS